MPKHSVRYPGRGHYRVYRNAWWKSQKSNEESDASHVNFHYAVLQCYKNSRYGEVFRDFALFSKV